MFVDCGNTANANFKPKYILLLAFRGLIIFGKFRKLFNLLIVCDKSFDNFFFIFSHF